MEKKFPLSKNFSYYFIGENSYDVDKCLVKMINAFVQYFPHYIKICAGFYCGREYSHLKLAVMFRHLDLVKHYSRIQPHNKRDYLIRMIRITMDSDDTFPMVKSMIESLDRLHGIDINSEIDFYTTTNYQLFVYLIDRWINVPGFGREIDRIITFNMLRHRYDMVDYLKFKLSPKLIEYDGDVELFIRRGDCKKTLRVLKKFRHANKWWRFTYITGLIITSIEKKRLNIGKTLIIILDRWDAKERSSNRHAAKWDKIIYKAMDTLDRTDYETLLSPIPNYIKNYYYTMRGVRF